MQSQGCIGRAPAAAAAMRFPPAGEPPADLGRVSIEISAYFSDIL